MDLPELAATPPDSAGAPLTPVSDMDVEVGGPALGDVAGEGGSPAFALDLAASPEQAEPEPLQPEGSSAAALYDADDYNARDGASSGSCAEGATTQPCNRRSHARTDCGAGPS